MQKHFFLHIRMKLFLKLSKVKLEVAIVFHERPEWSIVSCDQDVSKTFKAPSFHVALDVKISSPLSPLWWQF